MFSDKAVNANANATINGYTDFGTNRDSTSTARSNTDTGQRRGRDKSADTGIRSCFRTCGIIRSGISSAEKKERDINERGYFCTSCKGLS
jgi:hypothetical protein